MRRRSRRFRQSPDVRVRGNRQGCQLKLRPDAGRRARSRRKPARRFPLAASIPSSLSAWLSPGGRTPHSLSRSVRANTSAGGPSAAISPSRNIIIRSAARSSSDSCSITIRLKPCARSRAISSKTSALPSGSRSVVGSSSTMTDGRSASTDAIARRCFSPPDSDIGSRCSKPRSPTASSAGTIRRSISARSMPTCSIANATSCATLVENNCDSKSWKTMPTFGATSQTRRCSSGSPAIRIAPRKSPSSNSGMMRLRHLASVDLPAPDAPITPIISPADCTKLTARRAGRPAPW